MNAFMARLTRALVAATGLFLACGAQAADPVAFVSDFKGDVTLNGVGRPSFLAELLPGSTLVLGEHSTAAVMYVVSGESFSVKGPGEFVIARQGVKAVRGAEPSVRVPAIRASAKVLIQVSRTATASLRMRSAMAPRVERSGPSYPVDARIATLQPTLRWLGEPGAVHLVVVMASEGKEVFRGSARGLSLPLPSRLVADQEYSWILDPGKADARESRFRTLPAESISLAEKARLGANSFQDRVLLALLLHDLGATQDSREIWTKLAAERPDMPELAGLVR